MIVILGILASVAIPRLAATREDAEIATAVANLRTLVSEASAYYVAQGTFTGAKWNQITNVPLGGTAADKDGADTVATTAGASLKVKGDNCIDVQLVNKATTEAGVTTPAHIKFTANRTTAGSVCDQVQKSAAVKDDFLDKKVTKSDGKTEDNAIAVGSSTGVYKAATTK